MIKLLIQKQHISLNFPKIYGIYLKITEPLCLCSQIVMSCKVTSIFILIITLRLNF